MRFSALLSRETHDMESSIVMSIYIHKTILENQTISYIDTQLIKERHIKLTPLDRIKIGHSNNSPNNYKNNNSTRHNAKQEVLE